MNSIYKLFLLLLIQLPFYALAQQNIYLSNPSFEGEPSDAVVPVNWFACEPGTTPDILPGFWGVYNEPNEGDTFMGLITRPDGSFESIGQRLAKPFKAGECYGFAIDLAHSKTYAGYVHPIRLRVWAGRNKCGKDQLIAETDFISHRDWKTYNFQFTAKKKYNYIIIEAFFSEENPRRRGNILIDNLSAFIWCRRA